MSPRAKERRNSRRWRASLARTKRWYRRMSARADVRGAPIAQLIPPFAPIRDIRGERCDVESALDLLAEARRRGYVRPVPWAAW